MASHTEILRCGWLMNPGQPPQQNMRLSIVDGIVQEIRPLPLDEQRLAAQVVVMPVLVNAHTHLEFSRCAQPLPPPNPFTEWIRSVIDYRTSRAAEVADDVKAGVAESVTAGVGVLGEITTSADGRAAFEMACRDTGCSGVSFREVIGWSAERIAEQLAVATEHVAADGQLNDASIVRGLSPHAPYSVHPNLFDSMVEMAIDHRVPLALHLAETTAELQLLDQQTGPFADFLKSLELWDDVAIPPGTTPLAYLEKLAKVPHALAIHGNYFGDREIEFLGRHPNIAVVYCPRTHAWFQHPAHPWKKLRAAGATVVLGTDGRSSNPDLSVWKELQTVARQTTEPVWDLLPMITTTAAAALGLSPDDHTIREGTPFRAAMLNCVAESEAQLNTRLSDTATNRFQVCNMTQHG
ncbi:amidohydrolase family protein [Fuerstiella marisgermanici]|uniref:8-oxoguanine deaminase n=1 Tax=Fuerstiella marisgermanici TaxID=1891926 RepID=A0A1P8WAH3_9PLAN|nr:amidohydrolase family protein [Fuerstiella marisgermanici]APZ91034.1 8-oxoguanine deaminase [Fuerstiella marisgermanici]